MDKFNWIIKVATINDCEKWFSFVKNVTHDFYDIDLANDKDYRNVIIKNIKRKTAVYVEKNEKIIGGMIFSPNQNHIGWLAVDPKFRRRGIGTALVHYMLMELPDRKQFKVKTFMEGEWQSESSHPFYISLGFKPKEVNYDDMENNANHPTLLFVKENN